MKSTSFKRRGISVIYLAFIMVPLVAFLAVAWDFGRVRFGRAQLQNATDGAARAGAYGVPFNQAVNNATTIAGDNRCLLESVQLIGGDVKLGWWDVNKLTFTEIKATRGNNDPALTANAVSVRAYRTKDRNNPVNYLIMPVIGVNSGDITTLAVAMVRGINQAGIGFIGLTEITMKGNSYSDSYDPTAGPYSAGTAGSNGSIASNGQISLTGAVRINGDARPGTNSNVKITGSTTVTGWRAPLDYTLTYPIETAPANISPTNNDNGSLPAGLIGADGSLTTATTLPGGTAGSPKRYYFSSININGKQGNLVIGGNTIVLVGSGGLTTGSNTSLTVNDGGSLAPSPVKIYSQGDVSLGGGSTVQSGIPADLYISVITAGKSITLSGTSAFTGHLYDPTGAVTLNGTPDVYGWIIGKSLDNIKGDVGLHYDATNPADQAHTLSITLVE